jgi:molecular chaperone GrpE (heat shock protein)
MIDFPPASESDSSAQSPDSDPLGLITAELRSLRADFNAKIRYDEGREQILTAMGAELDQHRQGVFRMQLRPVLLDLVAMYDDISQLINSSEYPPVTVQVLELVRDTVMHTLGRNGAEQIPSEGDIFDRTVHKVVRMVPTEQPEADRRIAARLRPGFRWNDRVLRPEWVDVYRYNASAGEGAAEHGGGTREVALAANESEPGASDEPTGSIKRSWFSRWRPASAGVGKEE